MPFWSDRRLPGAAWHAFFAPACHACALEQLSLVALIRTLSVIPGPDRNHRAERIAGDLVGDARAQVFGQ